MGRKKSSADQEYHVYKAAYLWSIGKTQQQIAERLGIHTTQISRILAKARDAEILQTVYVPPADEVEMRRFINHVQLTEALEKHVKAYSAATSRIDVKSISVVDEDLKAVSTDQFDKNVKRFGPMAAPALYARLRQIFKSTKNSQRVVGVGWGRTVYSGLLGVAHYAEQLKPDKANVKCVPLWGDPFGPVIKQRMGSIFPDRKPLSSTDLARRLLLDFTGSSEGHYSLEALPIMIPSKFARTKSDHDLLLRYFDTVSARYEIFGPSEPELSAAPAEPALADQLDMIIAGVGSTEGKLKGRFLTPEVLETVLDKPEAKRLINAVYGDIGGILIPKDEDISNEYSHLWTGVRERHFKKCAERAQQDKDVVGVVALAIDSSRAKVVLEGIRRGIINHLIIDVSVAEKLKTLIAREMKPK